MIRFSAHPLTALTVLFCDFFFLKNLLFCDFQHPKCIEYWWFIQFSPQERDRMMGGKQSVGAQSFIPYIKLLEHAYSTGMLHRAFSIGLTSHARNYTTKLYNLIHELNCICKVAEFFFLDFFFVYDYSYVWCRCCWVILTCDVLTYLAILFSDFQHPKCAFQSPERWEIIGGHWTISSWSTDLYGCLLIELSKMLIWLLHDFQFFEHLWLFFFHFSFVALLLAVCDVLHQTQFYAYAGYSQVT